MNFFTIVFPVALSALLAFLLPGTVTLLRYNLKLISTRSDWVETKGQVVRLYLDRTSDNEQNSAEHYGVNAIVQFHVNGRYYFPNFNVESYFHASPSPTLDVALGLCNKLAPNQKIAVSKELFPESLFPDIEKNFKSFKQESTFIPVLYYPANPRINSLDALDAKLGFIVLLILELCMAGVAVWLFLIFIESSSKAQGSILLLVILLAASLTFYQGKRISDRSATSGSKSNQFTYQPSSDDLLLPRD